MNWTMQVGRRRWCGGLRVLNPSGVSGFTPNCECRPNQTISVFPLLSREAPREQIITHPPLAVFEILSPEDSMTRTLEKLADYEQMGIGAIWVVEPKRQLYYLYREGQLTPATVFELPGSPFSVPMAEIAALAD